MSRIFNVFAPSPIRPIEKHIKKVYECTRQLAPFFEKVFLKDWQAAAAINDVVSTLEREADDIKSDLRLHLPKGLFLPVARSDLLELLSAQDKIANKAQDIAGITVSRKMIIPESMHKDFFSFLNQCIYATEQACIAINELDDLLESGFRGNEVKIVEGMILSLDRIEHECDGHLSKIQDDIFSLESELPVLEIIFLYKIVQWIGEIADLVQVVGGRLQILIAR